MNDIIPIQARNQISINALKVLSRLNRHGYQAYLVGGSVRDMILGRAPKDFDIATDAHPEDVKSLFKNSRLIGRRFRIVHVRFGREIIEVATFRAAWSENQREQSENGMLLADNIYGTLEEDVFRRDFSINALYYSPDTGDVIDLVGGVDDIKAKKIRLLGDPENRYREDPARMLRAIRFKSKLDFDIDRQAGEPMHQLGYLLQDLSTSRLFEEVQKLFMTGHALYAFNEMLSYDLFGWLFPDSRRAMDSTPAEKLIQVALKSTDQRIANELPVTPAFVYAAILWYPFVEEKKKLEAEGVSYAEATMEASAKTIARQQLFTSIPRRFTSVMREIWYLQFRLLVRRRRKPDALLAHKRFRAAYDFLLIREEVGEKLDNSGEWWTRYQEADAAQRQIMKQSGKPGRRRRRKHQGTVTSSL
ncbi:MAG: polynucleotide adenylyltransferase PcnB [Gammaproteobacteria bacterium]|nr:polynucleotide adenylyltransferase PcnB [Gammaproteobacteria bacterium]